MIETAALWVEGLEDRSLIEFFAGAELHQDFGNWFVPTLAAVHALCRAAGFSEVRTVTGPPAGDPEQGESPRSSYYRAVVHAVV